MRWASPARERFGAAVERQVVEPYVDEELQPGAYLLDDLVGDGAALTREREAREICQRVFHGVGRDFGDRRVVDVDMAGFFAQARAAARGTGTHPQVLAEIFPHQRRLRFPVAALHVGNHAFETMPPPDPVAAIIEIAEVDALVARAEQDGVLLPLPEPPERGLHIEIVMLGEGLEQMEVVDIAPVPAANRPRRQA